MCELSFIRDIFLSSESEKAQTKILHLAHYFFYKNLYAITEKYGFSCNHKNDGNFRTMSKCQM